MTTYAEVKQIKRLLWEGHLTQTAIARRYKTSQPTISRIMNGDWWGDVPWPDKTTSTMSSDRCDVISASRHRHASLTSRNRAVPHPESKAAGYLRLSYDELYAEALHAKALSWKQVKTMDPAHPLVVAYEEYEPEPVIKSMEAILLIFFLLPIEEWGIAPTYELIERVRKELEK